jgi:hypothetical protein
MKLRIYGNSIRLRLTQTEVARLAAGKHVEQATNFSTTSKLLSCLRSSRDCEQPTATFDGSRLSVGLPAAAVAQWAASDQVGIEATQTIDADQSLSIVIEKDYQCLHADADSTPDAFPNPAR